MDSLLTELWISFYAATTCSAIGHNLQNQSWCLVYPKFKFSSLITAHSTELLRCIVVIAICYLIQRKKKNIESFSFVGLSFSWNGLHRNFVRNSHGFLFFLPSVVGKHANHASRLRYKLSADSKLIDVGCRRHHRCTRCIVAMLQWHTDERDEMDCMRHEVSCEIHSTNGSIRVHLMWVPKIFR